MFEVEHFLAAGNKLGEGPLWHSGERALYWVDIEEGCFYRYFPETGTRENFQIGQPVGCLAFRALGGLVLALRDGLGFWELESQMFQLVQNPEEGRKNARFNDGRVEQFQYIQGYK